MNGTFTADGSQAGAEQPVQQIGEADGGDSFGVDISLTLARSRTRDPVTQTIPEDAEATALPQRDYRAPWVHPEPVTA